MTHPELLTSNELRQLVEILSRLEEVWATSTAPAEKKFLTELKGDLDIPHTLLWLDQVIRDRENQKGGKL
jgi:hypothetical protein